jgi:hypothetical protein
MKEKKDAAKTQGTGTIESIRSKIRVSDSGAEKIEWENVRIHKKLKMRYQKIVHAIKERGNQTNISDVMEQLIWPAMERHLLDPKKHPLPVE